MNVSQVEKEVQESSVCFGVSPVPVYSLGAWGPNTKEKMELTRECYRAMIFYDFKARLNQEECVQRLQLGFGDESPCHATVFRWFKEFYSGHNSLQDEEHAGMHGRH
ncbi:histone-lysine N-methyltransferase SETMAR [Trichonephila clavipes]|nr:histone-lysine N-methyltransferase SETMAR [Trichonephila clavipes]